MSNFVGKVSKGAKIRNRYNQVPHLTQDTPILKFAISCHGNDAFSHSPYQIVFEDNFCSHSGGPNEQYGTHEKLSLGCKVTWMPG